MSRKALIVLAVTLAVLLVVGWSVASGPIGERWARARLIGQLERITRSKVELRSFRWRLARLEIEAEGLSIQGARPTSAQTARTVASAPPVPWMTAERITASLKILSLPRREFALRRLTVEKPVLHVIVYSDGSTNQPRPRLSSGTLLRFAVGRLQIQDGLLELNERRLLFSAEARGVEAQVSSAGEGKYRGSAQIRNVVVRHHDVPQSGSGELRFVLAPDEVTIESARWTAPDMRLEASGRIRDFRDPHAELSYSAAVPADSLARMAHVTQLRGGELSLSGKAMYAAGRYQAEGKLAARSVDWIAGDVRLRDITVGGDYLVNPETASFPHLFAAALGGTVTGSAEVTNWRAQLGENSARQQGRASLRVSSVALREAVGAMAGSSPLRRLNLSGQASGMVEVRWAGAPDAAVARFDMTIAPGTETKSISAHFGGAASEPLVVSGQVSGSYAFAHGSLQLDSFSVNGPALHLQMNGLLGTRAMNAQVTAESSNLAQVAPLLAALAPSDALSMVSAGEGSFSGTLRGSLRAPEVSGRAQANHVVLNLPVPGVSSSASGRKSREVRIDSASAGVQLSPDKLTISNGAVSLEAPSSHLLANGSVGLKNGSLTPASTLQGSITARDLSLDHFVSLASRALPLQGVVSGTLGVGGTWAQPKLAGDVKLIKAEFYGQRFRSIEAAVFLGDGQLTVRNLSAQAGNGQLKGTVTYDWRNRGYSVRLKADQLELAQIPQLQRPRLSVAGSMEFALEGAGTLDHPAIGGSLEIQRLTLNGENLGGWTMAASTHNGKLEVSGSSHFTRGAFSLAGEVGLQGEYPATLELTLARADVDSLLMQVLKGKLTGHSSVAGAVHISGPLRNPRLLDVKGSLDQVTASLEGVSLANSGPVEFEFTQDRLSLQQLKLTGEGTEFTATGSADLGGRERLQLNARGDVNLRLLQSFNPQLTSSGKAVLALQVRGTLQDPDLRGTIRLENGSLTHLNLPNGLSEINGTLVFNQERVEVQSLTARTGGGELQLGGFVNLGPQLSANLTAQGKGVRLRYPTGISSLLNLDLRLSGTRDAATLAGNIVVTRFGITPQFDVTAYRSKLSQPAQPNALSPWNRLRLDLHVTSATELRVETSGTKLVGDLDLQVRGTAGHPSLMGSVDFSEGELTFQGTPYRVNHADVTFSNPVNIEPVLDAELTTRVREYDITLNFHGPPDRLSTTYRSDPPLQPADVVGLLATGQTRTESAQVIQPDTSVSESEAQALLGNALNSASNDRVQRLFGVSRIRFAPADTAGAQSNPSSRVTIEQQVSHNVTLTYVTNLSQSTQQVIQMEYNVNRSFSVVATRDENGVVSLDFRLRQRKK